MDFSSPFWASEFFAKAGAVSIVAAANAPAKTKWILRMWALLFEFEEAAWCRGL
ncbi:hypothetical protein M2232_001626 [Bradyrhizobium japonicum]|uniref:hypothetical protein n=1 Tax=Bradyrhizobium japonicum TaxID=375 RepID=UPI000418B62D|nr:hypothetical protein [Bradyrhizobium japonicum]MCW2218094.1 hypothetical protein [Bradyrhizobium japonicum]MCW2342707.1 hypothetical protein [Bradyrhizobium japonicum]